MTTNWEDFRAGLISSLSGPAGKHNLFPKPLLPLTVSMVLSLWNDRS